MTLWIIETFTMNNFIWLLSLTFELFKECSDLSTTIIAFSPFTKFSIMCLTRILNAGVGQKTAGFGQDVFNRIGYPHVHQDIFP